MIKNILKKIVYLCFIGPMEYLRGKRFWIFTKKDEHHVHGETTSSPVSSLHSLNQGIWRSGIVGRRRR